jgi:hypothetical protein
MVARGLSRDSLFIQFGHPDVPAVRFLPHYLGLSIRSCTTLEVGVVLRPRGPRCCPSYAVIEPSSLTPSVTREHIAISPRGRLIRNAFAVRERRGDPRVFPGFR